MSDGGIAEARLEGAALFNPVSTRRVYSAGVRDREIRKEGA